MSKYNNELPDTIDAKETDYLYLKPSGIIGAGNGLFTSIQIYENEVISLFKGEILSNKEAALRAKNNMDGYFINMLDGSIMDSKYIACFAKYANDAEAYNKRQFRNNSKISLTENGLVCLVALRDIKISEEIFCSYGKKYWQNFKRN
ncbi:MAG: SET domain-containing protein-lysine N-methyltransferase [Bacteroidota bacterium]